MGPLREIDSLVLQLFSQSWTALHSSNALTRRDLKFPGVYLLSYTDRDLEGSGVHVRDVFYVGMSNSNGGVSQRLKQFRTGIEKNGLHSGAKRFFRDYCDNRPFSQANTGKRLYFAALSLQCVSDKAVARPDDFRQMGHVACLEYYVIAHVATQTGHNPPLNKLGRIALMEH